MPFLELCVIYTPNGQQCRPFIIKIYVSKIASISKLSSVYILVKIYISSYMIGIHLFQWNTTLGVAPNAYRYYQ